jgi:1-acyl-sn-glycerol-3-phosphate acyltransferase
MTDAWYVKWHRFCTALYFARVTVLHPERLPAGGPTLYLGLHRNGAVDGFIYHGLVPRTTFMISTQLRKNWFARLFFDGIAVVRGKDEGDRSVNAAALEACVARLRAGGELFVFPEGTSSLGPRHLPFKGGAVQIILDFLSEPGPPLQVVPLGIHYECPWAFRSKVEVVVGPALDLRLDANASPLGRIKELKRRMTAALEAVGVNFASEEDQVRAQRLAYVATLGTTRSYFASLKALERAAPARVAAAWEGLEPELSRRALLRHQGVPLFPMGAVRFYLVALLALAPVVLLAAAANLPPLLAGWWAGRRFPDGPNVIALWRILVGVPVFGLWFTGLVLSMGCLGQWRWLANYVAVTWLGLALYYRVKKLAVAVHNGLRHPGLRRRVLAFRELVLESLPDETA